MVASGEFHVVNMEPVEPLSHRFQMQPVADETEVLLDLGMASVVPIDHGGVAEFLEEKAEVRLEGNLLERLAVFDAELEAAWLGFVHNAANHLVGVFHVARLLLLPHFGDFLAELFVLRRVLLSFANEIDQLVCVIFHVHAAGVEHDQPGLHANGRLECLERVLEGAVALAPVVG